MIHIQLVDVSCKFDPSTGIVKWLFSGRDPYDTTGELADFLPPNKDDVAPKGEGWISYSIKLKSDLPSGTVIKNKATIDFEVDVPPAPMDTPEVFNTIDSSEPISSVSALSTIQNDTTFTISWSGSDDNGGAGIRDYNIYVSDNNNPYSLWITTSEISAKFTGQYGHKYSFYSKAKDNVGNIEDAPAQPDAATTIKIKEKYETTTTTTTSTSKKKKKFLGICFITDTFNKNTNIQIFSNFRDNHLLSNTISNTFVNFYYKISPDIATYFNEHKTLKSATRLILTPFIYVITSLLLAVFLI